MVHMFDSVVHWLPLGLPAFLFVITVVVFFHELGHFLAARAFGVAVETFSIGFGPAIFGWTDRHGTRWKVSWIPLGGYVKFLGDADAASTPDREQLEQMSPEERANAFQNKPLWHRAVVVAAGPAANFVVAILIFAATFMIFGQQILRPVIGTVAPHSAGAAAGLKPGDRVVDVNGERITSYADFRTFETMNAGERLSITVLRNGHRLTLEATPRLKTLQDGIAGTQEVGSLGTAPKVAPVVATVQKGSAAAAAGLKPGDRITAIDGQHIGDFTDMQVIVERNAGRQLTFSIQRDGKALKVRATPQLRDSMDHTGRVTKHGVLGITGAVDQNQFETVRYGVFGAVSEACSQTWFVVRTTMTYLWQIVSGQQNASQLTGPVGIAQVSEQVATIGLLALINLAALISVSIGLVNLFPVPILDGGHLLYYACEAVMGRPLGARAQDVGFRVGLAVMLGLMVLATWNDLVRLNLF